MATEKLYLERDNTIDLLLKEDGVAVDLSAATSVIAVIGTETIASTDETGGLIKWSGAGFDTGEIRLDCANDSGLIDQGAGTWDVPIITIDPSNPLGIDWGVIRVQVFAKRGT